MDVNVIRMFALGCFVTASCGCGVQPQSPPAYVSPIDAVRQLVSPKNAEELGVIPLGYEQEFVFPVSNPSDDRLTLAVVHSSCACLNATIDQRDLPARGSTAVRAKLHATDTSTAGPMAAQVRIAASGTGGEKYGSTLTIRAVIEGLSMEPGIMRVPRSILGWQPGPLRGVFFFDEVKGDVEVVELEWSMAGGPEGVTIGEPTLSPVRDKGGYAVRLLSVPLRVETPHRPAAGVYEGSVGYRVHGVESRTKFVLKVVDKLEQVCE